MQDRIYMITISIMPQYYWLPQFDETPYCGKVKYQSVRPDETTELN